MSAATDYDDNISSKGAWVGIDLGTTNCTAAVSLLMLNCVYILPNKQLYHLTTIYNNFSVMTYQDHDVKYFDLDIKI